MRGLKRRDEKSLTLKAFALLVGVPYKTLFYRIRVGGHSVLKSAFSTCADLQVEAHRKHGMHDSLVYSRWESMIHRCGHHPHYLKLGIRVCDRWRSFENFLADMGEPRPGMTLERENGKKGYEPGNCVWASRTAQSRNVSRNMNVEAFGKTQCVAAWAQETGIRAGTIRHRILRGVPPEAAIGLKPFERYRHVGR
jgi:hypothetical protein